MSFILEHVTKCRFLPRKLRACIEAYKNGLEIIGENEIFYADMGLTYLQYYEVISEEDSSIFDKADDCVKKVFALNPESSHGHCLKRKFISEAWEYPGGG